MDTVAITMCTTKSNNRNILLIFLHVITPNLDLGKCLGIQHCFLVCTEFVFVYCENSPSFQVYHLFLW